jgi:hypothetical protein
MNEFLRVVLVPLGKGNYNINMLILKNRVGRRPRVELQHGRQRRERCEAPYGNGEASAIRTSGRGADSRTESRKSREGLCRIRSSDRSPAPSRHDSHLDVRSQWNESRGRHEHTQNDTYPFLHARAALRAAPVADHYGRAQGAHPRRPSLANHGDSVARRPIAAASQAHSPLIVRARLRNGRPRNWPPVSSNVRVTACSKSALCPW